MEKTSITDMQISSYESAMKLRPIDDICGSVFFQDSGCVQILLHAIYNDSSIHVHNAETQETISDLFSRGVRLDVVAIDDANRSIYNIEFQTSKNDCGIDRAFYNHAMLAGKYIHKGTLFKDFPFTKIIFVLEDDYLKTNKPISKVSFFLDNDPSLRLDSKLKIIYVNANFQDRETALGRVLHDICCSNANDMFYPEYQQRMRQVKKLDREEMRYMCKVIDEIEVKARTIGRNEGRLEGRLEGYQDLLDIGLIKLKDLQKIHKNSNLNLSTLREPSPSR